MSDKKLQFGDRLKIHLDIFGISQVELAKNSGLTPAAVSQIINHKRDPSLSSVVAIIKGLKKRAPTSIDYLVFGQ